MAADGRKKILFWGSVTYLDELISLGLVDLGVCKPESNLSDVTLFVTLVPRNM